MASSTRMRSICLPQQLLGSKVRGAKHREANDPETEIWRGCQRSGTARLLVMAYPPGCIFLTGLAKT